MEIVRGEVKRGSDLGSGAVVEVDDEGFGLLRRLGGGEHLQQGLMEVGVVEAGELEVHGRVVREAGGGGGERGGEGDGREVEEGDGRVGRGDGGDVRSDDREEVGRGGDEDGDGEGGVVAEEGLGELHQGHEVASSR